MGDELSPQSESRATTRRTRERTLRRLHGRHRGLAIALAVGAISQGCHLRGINSDVLLGAFNGGAIDSSQDPTLTSKEIAIERVTQTLKESLVRGFDTQGIRSGPSIATWLEDRQVKVIAWKHVLKRLGTCAPKPPIPVGGAPVPAPPTPPGPAASASPASSSNAEPGAVASPSALASANASSNEGVAEVSNAPSAPVGQTSPVAQSAASLASDVCADDFFTELYGYLLTTAPSNVLIPAGPVCNGTASTPAGGLYADAAKLAAALDIASIDLARMLSQERVLDSTQAEAGLVAAMDEAACYMRDRRWKPSPRTPTFGLAIKGGASTGVYSAGVVWRVLTLLQRYRAWKAAAMLSRPHDPRLLDGISPDEARISVTSGTSAGAIIAAVTDIFHEESCTIDCDIDPNPDVCKQAACKDAASCQPNADRSKLTKPSGHYIHETGATCQEYARRLTSSLFTCPSQAQLYCVDSRPLWNLMGTQQGLMDFDGLRDDYLAKYVGADSLRNSTELVLTTVDFRWAQLYVQSDQDPSTVETTFPVVTPCAERENRRNIQASFVLPFIAWPVRTLRVHNAERSGTYVDGGIQSEVPINALTERGVERAIVVGSSPPQSTPTGELKTALTIASRYIDVSLSGVTATEWKGAVPHARYVEAFEYSACKKLFERSLPGRPSGLPNDDEAVEAFCSGRLTESCGGVPYAPTAKRDGADSPLSGLSTKDVQTITNHESGRRFDLVGIFRDESVAPTFGYSFDPIQMRRLFATGVSDARRRCVELAFFLGMGDAVDQLDLWCNESPKFEPLLCEPTSQDYKTCPAPPENTPVVP